MGPGVVCVCMQCQCATLEWVRARNCKDSVGSHPTLQYDFQFISQYAHGADPLVVQHLRWSKYATYMHIDPLPYTRAAT